MDRFERYWTGKTTRHLLSAMKSFEPIDDGTTVQMPNSPPGRAVVQSVRASGADVRTRVHFGSDNVQRRRT